MEDTNTAYRELIAKPMDNHRQGSLVATANDSKKTAPAPTSATAVSAAVRYEYNRMLETLNEAQALEASLAFTRR